MFHLFLRYPCFISKNGRILTLRKFQPKIILKKSCLDISESCKEKRSRPFYVGLFLSLQKQSPEVFCARVSFLIKLHALGLQLY